MNTFLGARRDADTNYEKQSQKFHSISSGHGFLIIYWLLPPINASKYAACSINAPSSSEGGRQTVSPHRRAFV
jgi:hypothetical protein